MRYLFIVFMILCFTIGTLSQVKAETSTTETYRVGVNDVLNISVLKEQGLTGSYTVTSDGTITFHYIGTIYVKGMKLSKIEDLITKKLSDEYIKYPLVSVSLSSSGKKIIAFGVIRIHGEIRFQDNMTVMAGLALAGGATSDGLFGKIKVLRVKKGVTGEREVFVESILNYGAIVNSKVANTLLQVDDILIVEHNDTILIQGNVASRGLAILEKDMTVGRVLLQAGGISQDGLFGKIKIRRKQEGKAGGYKDLVESKLDDGVIENKEVEDMLLKPDDILIVDREKTYFIYGEANKTGEFILRNDMTVFKAITIAGGFTKWGAANRVKVLRKSKNNDGFELIRVNIDDVIKGDAAADVYLQAGDTIVVSSGVF